MYEDEQIRNIACLALARSAPKANYLDIGALGGPDSDSLKYLMKKDAIDFFGIEPDPAECANLSHHFPGATFLPYAVADQEGTRTFYKTNANVCCSCLEPNMELLAKYPIRAWFHVSGTSQIDVTTVQSLIDKGLLPQPHFIKSDVQGLDYEVLVGCGPYLDSVVGIELEAQFAEIYKGQKLLFDIIQYLNKRGFVLRHLSNAGPYEHELLECNAFFSRSPNDPSVNIFQLKLWEFMCKINSPASLGQLKTRGLLGENAFALVEQSQLERLLGDVT